MPKRENNINTAQGFNSMGVWNGFKIIEYSAFLILIFLIVSSFFISDSKEISTYEKFAGHSINKFTVKIILLFKDIFLIVLASAILIATYLKFKHKVKHKEAQSKNQINNILIGLLFPLIVFLLMQLFFTGPFLDDSFISFRYARNFFETGQLTFNVGEAPVEGYTHPLWILLMQMPQFLGMNLFLFVKLAGLSFSLAGIILVYILSDKNAVATWLYSLSASVIGWSMTGLETPMYTTLSLFFIYLFLKEKYLLSSLILFLVTLTRPEGLVLIFPAIFILVKYRTSLFRNLTKVLVPFSLTYLFYMFWKYSYFGNFLPNTFYAKYIFLRGIPYIVKFIFSMWPIILIVLIYFAHKFFFKQESNPNANSLLDKKKYFSHIVHILHHHILFKFRTIIWFL